MTHTIKTLNPATEETIEELELDGPRRIETALGAAHSAFQTWRRRPIEQRAGLLRALGALLRSEEATHAAHITREMGKPFKESRAEVAKCASACEYFADNAARVLADEAMESGLPESYVSFEPLGPVLGVMPWNFPYWQVFRAAAPALMAGNVMLIKHAANVSRCALEIASLFERASAPRGVLQVLLLSHEAVADVSSDERIVAATLTGSESAGASLAGRAGAQLKTTVLELGGSDAFIVLADADVEQAAKTAVRARFQNTGQSCIAAKRFLVEAPAVEPFTRHFLEGVRALRTGDPTREATDLGPLARRDLRDELERQVEDSVKAGARVLVGGKRRSGKGFFFESTVLTDVPDGAPVLREEVFGPVAPIIAVRDADEAVEKANATRFGLSNNLWTRDLGRARSLARELASGMVFINGMTASDPHLPFGGIKKSGYGRELSAFGLRAFVNVKTVGIGLPGGDASGRPPVE